MADGAAPRSGLFWASIEGRAPVPPAARTLGFTFLEADPDNGTIRLEFDGSPDFTNPRGEILGGFLAAMLYDTVGPALLATIGANEFIETDDLAVSFHHPARPGTITGHGEIVDRDNRQVSLAARLWDHTGTLVASATAHARVVPLQRPEGVDRDRPKTD
ncbi:PaaI family thioesterase [Microlunatus soli]|uniref:PaaI family thioesterase n=1 Tax=Microlunatus soli TaxID=630515 RepID=UPI0018D3D099|nr:PaaI family thioesterase [Microlunatus soli]